LYSHLEFIIIYTWVTFSRLNTPQVGAANRDRKVGAAWRTNIGSRAWFHALLPMFWHRRAPTEPAVGRTIREGQLPKTR